MYDGLPAPPTRDILSVGVYVCQGFGCCPAYWYHSEDLRLFRLDRIRLVKPATWETPASVQQAMERLRLETWWTEDPDEMPDPTVECLRVGLTPRRVQRAQEDLWLSRYLTVHADKSGILTSFSGNCPSLGLHTPKEVPCNLSVRRTIPSSNKFMVSPAPQSCR